ncbi:MAG: hypothetical protein CMM61_05690 [Rhodospirillaceae bacterium]|nr:hypothetical protein [Rhodospirillaceae bacterium]
MSLGIPLLAALVSPQFGIIIYKLVNMAILRFFSNPLSPFIARIIFPRLFAIFHIFALDSRGLICTVTRLLHDPRGRLIK